MKCQVKFQISGPVYFTEQLFFNHFWPTLSRESKAYFNFINPKLWHHFNDNISQLKQS